MPLIVVCGFPCSGKTLRANQLQEYFAEYLEKNKQEVERLKLNSQVVIVNDEMLKSVRQDAYFDSNQEKKFRGQLISCVERYLNKETIVILDSLNYIKGFRYQLHCIAKTLNTTHCIVYCGCSQEFSIENNQNRIDGNSDSYSADQVTELISRFEEPDSRNRWDSPLFILLPQDPIKDQADKIFDSLLKRQASKPNFSTVRKPLTDSNYVFELEKTIQDIIDKILESQRSGIQVSKLIVPKSKMPLQLPSNAMSLPLLRKLKRQFVSLNNIHTVIDQEQVATMFVDYLHRNFRE